VSDDQFSAEQELPGLPRPALSLSLIARTASRAIGRPSSGFSLASQRSATDRRLHRPSYASTSP
jgi:hypothetical protein